MQASIFSQTHADVCASQNQLSPHTCRSNQLKIIITTYAGDNVNDIAWLNLKKTCSLCISLFFLNLEDLLFLMCVT